MLSFAKRSISMLVAFVLVVGLLSGITLPADAASYTYNWGTREEVATSLSDAAVAFYEKNNVTYADLAALSGSSNRSSVPSSALYQRLKTLMTDNHDYKTSYDATKSLYQYTDCQNGGGKISSFYSGASIGPGWGEGGSWNREHTWPNSKGLGGQDENDIMMLRPTATSENSSRGNTAYGESGSYYDPNDESGGTYNLHGDVARIVLYVYVRWGNTSYMWGTSGVMESVDVLLKWMEEDPVDTWELGRNDAVESITGTRNVFVDYPELAFTLFGQDVPNGYTSPSGGVTTSYTVTATSGGNGTVSVSGRTITATPNTGYYASGYKIVSGEATVTQNGNVFTVSPDSDCTVQITFAPREQATMTFNENGITTQKSGYAGDIITLPQSSQQTPDGFTFLGWVTAPVEETATKPTVYAAGNSYTLRSTTLYALYSKQLDDGTGSGEWILLTDASILAPGAQLVIAYSSASAVAGEISGDYLGVNDAVFSSDESTITSLPAEAIVFTLGGDVDKWTLTSASGKVLGTSGTKKMVWDSGTTTWKISVSSGSAVITSTGGYGVLQYNADHPRFTTYSSGQKSPNLYIMDGSAGSIYYTTTATVCAHSNQTTVQAQPATCTESGHTAGVFCNDCQRYISGNEIIPAAGHNYEAVVTGPTATEQGYTTYTCSVCFDSYVTDYVEALGPTYTVKFVVPDGVTAIADMPCNNRGITLPAAGIPTGRYTYSFLGWADAQADNVTTEPGYRLANSAFTATANTTFYALYTYTLNGTTYYTTVILPVCLHETMNPIAKQEATCVDAGHEAGQQCAVCHIITGCAVIPATGNHSFVNGSCSVCGTSEVIRVVIYNPEYGKALSSDYTGFYNIGVDVTESGSTLNGYSDAEIWTLIDNGDGTYSFTYEDQYLGMDSDYTSMPLDGAYTDWEIIPLGDGLYNIKNTGRGNYIEWYADKDNWCAYSNSSTDYATDPLFQQAFYVVEGTLPNFGGSTTEPEPDPEPKPDPTYTLSFRVPSGVTAVADQDSTLSLPTAGAPSGYTFLGWVTGAVDNVTEKPSFYAAGSTVTVSQNTVLYALYTYEVEDSSATQQIVFNLGADGTGSYDNGTASASYSETVGTYTFSYSNGNRTFPNCRDASGNSAIKLGSSKGGGSFSFTVDDAVMKVVINIANYNSDTGTATVAGTSTTLTTSSSTGTYIPIEVDTSSAKTVSVSTSKRAMINSITYVVGGGNTAYYTTVIGSAPEFKFKSASLTIQQGISVNFKVLPEVIESGFYTDHEVTFQITDYTFTTSDYTVDENGLYSFTLYNIRPDWMNETITATITGKDASGNEVSNQVTYSILRYCTNTLNKSISGEMKTLLVDLLNYGAAAQIYTKHDTENLVNKNLTDDQKSYGTTTTPAHASDLALGAAPANATVTWGSASLFLRETTRLYFTVNTSVTSGLQVKVSIDGYEMDPITLTDEQAISGGYGFYMDYLTPMQLRAKVILTVCDANGNAVSAPLTYSAQTYAHNEINAPTTENLPELMIAMLRYGDAAIAYQNSIVSE